MEIRVLRYFLAIAREFSEWFGEDFDRLDIVTTFNFMADAGIGYAITIDKLANTTEILSGKNIRYFPLQLKGTPHIFLIAIRFN